MNAVVATPIVTKSWSPYQESIFAFAALPARGKRLVIKASAGSGKSTTGLELIKRVAGDHIFLAFNKDIVEELKGRGANAATFHSLCFRPVMAARRIRTVDKDKVINCLRDRLSEERFRLYGSFAKKLVGLAKNAGIGCLVDDTESAWDELASHHDLELESEHASWADAIAIARRALDWNNQQGTGADFDDLLYFAVLDGIRLPKFDNVVVDEGQDTNVIQIAIIRKLLKDDSDLYVVGDDAQAIYGFRGADSDALNNIIREFNAVELPLTVSYRCARAIVNYAKQFGDIEAAPSAAEGTVDTASRKALTDLTAGDLVVSRCTAPLIEAAYGLLKARVPAYVKGRDIGAGLNYLIDRVNAKGIDRLIEKLNDFTAREVEKAIAKNQEEKAASIQDKTSCVLFLIESLPETDRTIPALKRVIEDLFTDKANAVVLSTVHRAKGLEADTVVWLNHDYVSKWAHQEWQIKQEFNLCFVAATRAKFKLVLVPTPKKEKE